MGENPSWCDTVCMWLHLHYLCSFLASACELTVQWELWPTCLCLSVTLWIWPWYQSRARSTTSRPASRESFSCSSSFICFNCVSGKLKKRKEKKRWCFEGDGGRRGGRRRVRWWKRKERNSIKSSQQQNRLHRDPVERKHLIPVFPMPSLRELSDGCQD